MSDMGITSPEAFKQDGVAATVEQGSRIRYSPEEDLERNIRGTYREIETEVDRLTRIRNQLRLESDQGEIVGAELGERNAQLFIGLTDLVDQLNDQGASIRGEQLTVAGLIAPDAKIKIRNTQIGNFQIEGTRTFTDGEALLNEILSQDVKLYSNSVGGSNINVSGLPSAFEALSGSIEARPEIETAIKEGNQEADELTAQITALQKDADDLRASIGEDDTKGQKSTPLAPQAQVVLLDGIFERNITNNQFDFRRRVNRLDEIKPAFVAEPSDYESPEVRAARNMRATVDTAPAEVDPVSQPPSQVNLPRASQPASDPALRGRSTVSPEVRQAGGPPGQQNLAGLANIDPGSRAGELIEESFDTGDDGNGVNGDDDGSVVPGSGVTPQLTATQIRAANQAEVEALLAEQFGGFSFFLQKNESDLQVGLTADGRVVEADDPEAATVKNILDVIVEQGITAPTRVLGLLENTEWWQTTDAKMREYDVLTADMSEPQKLEYLEPVLDTLRDEAQFLGFQLDGNRARALAEKITRFGEETDSEYIRDLLTAEAAFNSAEVAGSSFAAARNEIMAMSRRYFTPISEADAATYAEDIYVGRNTAEGVENLFRNMAANTMPQLQSVLDAGYTPEQYFAPYKYEIERMLDRPNVNLYEEFGDVIQHIPEGGGQARPMTLGELRKYVRGLPEWQQSTQGKDSARSLAFAIGKTFGEVA